MVTVAVLRSEYQKLKRQANAYRRFVAQIFESSLHDPVDDVVKDFKNTNLYSEEFLMDLENGLRRSSYAKQHESKTAKRGY